jgi:hypothetical protein
MGTLTVPESEAQATVEYEVATASYAHIRVVVQDNSLAFVAKPIRVRTRKGRNYHVLRVTIPKVVAERLNLGTDDYLLLRAKVAQWFHLPDWTEMPEIWRRLPREIQSEIVRSNLPHPTQSGALPSPTSPAGLVAAAGSSGTGSVAVSP